MADYAKKTVADLTEILKSRGLPSSGKKAELVARLNEHDKTSEATATEAAEEPAPVEEPVQEAQAEPQAEAPAEAVEPAAETTYTLNLKASELDSELAKRKARAERFGTGSKADETTDANTDEKLKNLERAKRFGTETNAISRLDGALPSEREKRGKRKAEDSDQATGRPRPTAELDDPGLKKGFANRIGGAGQNRRGRGGRQGNARGPQGVTKSRPPPAYTSEKDKLAAEARKKKFATA